MNEPGDDVVIIAGLWTSTWVGARHMPRKDRRQKRDVAKRKPPSQRTERTQPDPNSPQSIATHEAGHAVAAVVLGLRLNGVSIKCRRLPDGRISLGFTDCPIMTADVAGKGEETAHPILTQCLSGPMAETRTDSMPMRRDVVESAFQDDFAGARMVATVAVCTSVDRGDGKMFFPPEEIQRRQPQLSAMIRRALEAAEQLVSDHWSAIAKVSSLLLERQELTGDEVAEIVRAAKDGDAL
jgi:hypothetical protein